MVTNHSDSCKAQLDHSVLLRIRVNVRIAGSDRRLIQTLSGASRLNIDAAFR